EFVGALVQLRRRFSQLRSRHWLEGRKANGEPDVLWLRPGALGMKGEDLRFPEGRFLAYVLGATNVNGEPLFVVFNASPEGIEVNLPAWPGVEHWSRVLDTNANLVLAESAPDAPGTRVTAPPVSILAFTGRP